MQIKSIDPVSLKKRLDEGSAILIDVREPHEHAREHIEGARLVPLSRSKPRISAMFATRPPSFIAKAAAAPAPMRGLLTSKGFRDAYHLAAASSAWKAAGLPTRSKRAAPGEDNRKRFGLF